MKNLSDKDPRENFLEDIKFAKLTDEELDEIRRGIDARADLEAYKKTRESHAAATEKNAEDNTRHRSRSLTVGNLGGGGVEISLRNEFYHLHYPLQPVEVVEYIEQLAAAIGVYVYLQPKYDFASWRTWDRTESSRFRGSAPDLLGINSVAHLKGSDPEHVEFTKRQLNLTDEHSVETVEETTNE